MVFCYAQNKIVPFQHIFSQRCAQCPYYSGTAQGQGVECIWRDNRMPVGGIKTVWFPQQELQRLNSNN